MELYYLPANHVIRLPNLELYQQLPAFAKAITMIHLAQFRTLYVNFVTIVARIVIQAELRPVQVVTQLQLIIELLHLLLINAFVILVGMMMELFYCVLGAI